jgi:AcrR family transcriptional regulator
MTIMRRRVGRWEPDARGRLVKAALELYAERGYEGTTVADIAERAGLTKRTYFRHFADKREVLFDGSPEVQRVLLEGITGAPPDAAPLEAIARGLDAVSDLFTDRYAHARRRLAIVGATPELMERELIKMATLAAAVAAALRERGVPEPAASLGAESGIAVFKIGFARWVEGPEAKPLRAHMREGMAGLRGVAATAPAG